MDSEYIIFESSGEPSKDLMGTAVVASLTEKYPERKIVVTTLNPEIWLHNPNVYRVYNIQHLQYFFDDYIQNRNTLVFKNDPYKYSYFVKKKEHLIDSWCKQCGVDRKDNKPQIYLTAREKEVGEGFVKRLGNKPTCIIQTTGAVGTIPYPTSFSRDLHNKTAQEVVLNLQKKGFTILQLKAPSQEKFPGAIPVELGLRETLAIFPHTTKRLFIDSIAHHASTALGLPGVVTWNTLTPELHGYEMHTNILPTTDEKFDKIQKDFVEEFRVTQIMPEQLPHYDKPLHSAEEIIKALEI